jgi:hypothetical protein
LNNIELEDSFDFLCEPFNIIAYAGCAELAKVGKILPYLSGINTDKIG